MGEMLIIEVEDTGERRRLQRGRLSIGRGDSNDWVIEDGGANPTLSRRHCLIEASDDGFRITDLGSTNGTQLNGRRLPPHAPAPLGSGDQLRLGKRALRVAMEMPDSASAPAVAAPRHGPGRAGVSLDALLGGLASADPAPDAPAPQPLPDDGDPLGDFFDERPRTPSSPLAPPKDRGTTQGDHGQPQLESFGLPPVGSPPVTPPDPAPTSKSSPTTPDGALLRAFLEGAGLEPNEVPAADAEALMRDAGRVFAAMAEGLQQLLAARAMVKTHAGLERTVIGATANNPLKYSVAPREAVTALLRRREEGYLAPLPTVEASFRDLKAHELALLDGMRAAVASLLGRFDPKVLEGDLADASTLSVLLQGGRRARLWELYTERYGELAEAARLRFLGDLDRAFAEAYESKVREHPAGRASGTGTGR